MSDSNDDKTVVLGGAAASTPAASASAHAADAHSQNALPLGTRLGEFEVVGLVGEGGFGIVYLAHDHSLERKVALKEYMPSSLASRATNASVAVRSERHRETFEVGRRSFVNEARLLAQFDHPALVKVYRFWEDNGTAYMAMPFYDGITLRDALKARGSAPDESWIRKILLPVMDALEIIHNQSCYHRDIAPDNIMLLADDRPVLLDFGAARRVIGDMTQALTVILKPGYAPIEQYAEMPGMKQGPWTDIYALGAVVYFMITGKTPPPSVGRMMQDSFEPLATLVAGKYGDAFLRGIDQCLAVKAEDRPQSIAEMRQAVGIASASPLFAPTSSDAPARSAAPRAASQDGARTVAASSQPSKPEEPSGKRNTVVLLGAAAGAVVLAGVGAYFALAPKKPEPVPTELAVEASAPAAKPSVAQTPTAAPAAEPAAAKPVSLPEAQQRLLASASADFGVQIDKVKSPAAIGRDALGFSLRAAKGGYVYLFLHDKGTGMVFNLFPNALDPDNLLPAGRTMRFPRENWTYDADVPRGDWEVTAIVSESPRDFPGLGLTPQDGILSAPLAAVEAALTRNGVAAISGALHCADGASQCGDAYGATSFSVNEADAPVAAAPAPKPAGSSAPASKPAQETKPAKSREKAPAQDPANAEAEYMKKLNSDLDQLLGGKK
ncbi:serine/threonine-protein kinase [Niveibacterium sp. 24ML]|uniref:serine/threonine-protein kinase n=1 Tax=Niveibacterium sp. 24ML TaxID=2985512 RepID=UPI00226F6CA0|nr:serine/threonine-protein kinase [Niveibacterium sp. 24ML]MCX9156598.1 serine/threonine-protein kinase [Niveibacterium sp. 24ML]